MKKSQQSAAAYRRKLERVKSVTKHALRPHRPKLGVFAQAFTICSDHRTPRRGCSF